MQYAPHMSPASKLSIVENAREIAASHRAFVRELAETTNLAIDLVRRSRYWIYDPATRTLSPVKFSGYAGMDFKQYQRARAGHSTGVKFDSEVTQRAIAQVLGAYREDPELVEELERW